MTSDGARDVLHLRVAQAGVADVHPHRFRHTFAHRWLAGGGQERDLRMLAGWRIEDMLSRYAASTAVERAHEAHRLSAREIVRDPVQTFWTTTGDRSRSPHQALDDEEIRPRTRSRGELGVVSSGAPSSELRAPTGSPSDTSDPNPVAPSDGPVVRRYELMHGPTMWSRIIAELGPVDRLAGPAAACAR
ncbi:Phage integrase family protein [Geodermatophilus amargosae]|uniref:Phage integrase family protein n=1 Tax=Geodermatophilus amargosae TaxID=1296565 RepID=A0A1I7CPF1_9ACTN|nr:Phage integrase family protein [Geodermatophilus amargosae]